MKKENEALHSENEALKVALQKSDYRIRHLIRSLEEEEKKRKEEEERKRLEEEERKRKEEEERKRLEEEKRKLEEEKKRPGSPF